MANSFVLRFESNLALRPRCREDQAQLGWRATGVLAGNMSFKSDFNSSAGLSSGITRLAAQRKDRCLLRDVRERALR